MDNANCLADGRTSAQPHAIAVLPVPAPRDSRPAPRRWFGIQSLAERHPEARSSRRNLRRRSCRRSGRNAVNGNGARGAHQRPPNAAFPMTFSRQACKQRGVGMNGRNRSKHLLRLQSRSCSRRGSRLCRIAREPTSNSSLSMRSLILSEHETYTELWTPAAFPFCVPSERRANRRVSGAQRIARRLTRLDSPADKSHTASSAATNTPARTASR